MTSKFFLTFIIVFFSFSAFSTNIRVLDFQKIIENNVNVSLLYKKIDSDQVSHKENFKKEELNLQNELTRIEDLNLILDPSELKKEVDEYNKKLNIFNKKIEKFNFHYELQINNLKNQVVDIILETLKKYSEDNQIELILDSSNYILSSNSINITEIILDQVNNKKIEINFEKY